MTAGTSAASSEWFEKARVGITARIN